MTYTIEELKKLWKRYEDSMSISIFKDGVWVHSIREPNQIIKFEGVRCKVQKTENTMSFIEFLEKVDG